MAKTFTRYSKTFDPRSVELFKISRSKIDFFQECPRCFYLSERLGVKRPSMAPFLLNVAVDALLKKEFDIHRAKGTAHPLMKSYGVEAVPFKHKDIDRWRENFVGLRYADPKTNLLITGAVDDIWVNEKGELHVVDYKATAKEGKVEKLEDTRWHNQYRRQIEVYQWLLRKNGFPTSDIGYFVYVNGKKDREAFDGKLEFDVAVISHLGNSSWIDQTLQDIHDCLRVDAIPATGALCEYCPYRESAGKAFQGMVGRNLSSQKKLDEDSQEQDNHSNAKKTQTLF